MPQRRNKLLQLGNGTLHFSHSLAHGVGEKIAEPVINALQCDTFKNPSRHTKQIDRQMHRIFRRAQSSVKSDTIASKFLFAQFALAIVLGEHVPYPLQWTPLPHGLTAIPLPFDVHLTIPFPPGDILNHIPGVHAPTEFASNGPFWPLLTSDIIMAGAVNIPNAIRAYREKRPVKSFWYTLSIPGAFLHLPFIFNSFWFELATRPAERKAGQTFAEKVTYVLDGSNAPKEEGLGKEPTTRLGKLLNHIPAVRTFRENSTGETHIKPEDRHIFANAVRRRFTQDKPRDWWQEHLRKVAWDVQHDVRHGILHADQKIQQHTNQKSKFPKNVWNAILTAYHKHMKDRLEEKQEAVATAQDFIRHAK